MHPNKFRLINVYIFAILITTVIIGCRSGYENPPYSIDHPANPDGPAYNSFESSNRLQIDPIEARMNAILEGDPNDKEEFENQHHEGSHHEGSHHK